MAKTNQHIYYSDFTNNFMVKQHSKEILINENEKAVSGAIKNLIMCGKGEYLYQPLKGCGVRKYLFEIMDERTANQIKDEIENTIKINEPRAELIYASVTPDYDNYQYIISIYFRIITSETPIILTIPIKAIR